MTPSPDLYKFFLAYRAWVDAGAPEDEPFTRRWGLCTNWCIYSGDYHDDITIGRFIRANSGDSFAPFNCDGHDYDDDAEARTQHLNPKRLAFVDEMITRGREEYGDLSK